MRALLLILLLTIYACVSSPSPNRVIFEKAHVQDPQHAYKTPQHNTRLQRSQPHYVKSGRIPVNVAKTYIPSQGIRKGEFMCGDKVCTQLPGQEPSACVDCQHSIYLDDIENKNLNE